MPSGANRGCRKHVRLFVCDAARLFRQALICLLSRDPSFLVIGEAETGRQTCRLCERLSPDVVLLDVWLPDMSGFDAARELLRQAPEIRIILLAAEPRRSDALEAIASGAAAYLPKEAAVETLVLSIHQTVTERTALTQEAVEPLLLRYGRRTKKLPSGAVRPALTRRQRQILEHLTQGASNRDIARALGVKDKTVRNLLSEVYQLLGVRSRTEAVLYVLQKGWEASEG